MASEKQKLRDYLVECENEMKIALESGNLDRIALAHAYLGYTLVQMKKAKEGMNHFNDALEIASELEDIQLKVRCLGVKVMAFQLVGRLPDAFTAAKEIESIASDEGDLGMKSDALASQGQILFDSGDPIGACEKFDEALNITVKIDDKQRQMNVRGALGNYNLALSDYDKAGEYFSKAIELARELDDRQSEIGYLGNLGSLFEWEREYSRANEIFSEVLSYLQEVGDMETEPFALKHLIQVNGQLNEYEKVTKYALRGIELTKEEKPAEALHFFKELISVYYLLSKYEEGNAATKEAIEIARTSKDRKKEFDFLLSLGESNMLTNHMEEALEAYKKAEECAQRLQHHADKAYLLGRIGLILAETGNFTEAISNHEEAIKLAKLNKISELEGEQLSMLGMTYRDKGEMEKALDYANQALEVFQEADLKDESEKVRALIKEIKAVS